MEFWLSFNNKAEVLRLPVVPPSFEISKGNNINVVNITEFGEIAVIGIGKLATIEISSFFPIRDYPFCQYSDFPKPYECVNLIERWKDSKRPIRLIITDTNINMACCIEDFKYSQKDGSGDVYFSLSLKEYRFVTVTNSALSTQQTNISSPVQRPVEDKVTPNNYVVKEGDSLWVIAKKVYGDGSKYTLILQANGLKSTIIQPGQKLVIA